MEKRERRGLRRKKKRKKEERKSERRERHGLEKKKERRKRVKGRREKNEFFLINICDRIVPNLERYYSSRPNCLAF